MYITAAAMVEGTSLALGIRRTHTRNGGHYCPGVIYTLHVTGKVVKVRQNLEKICLMEVEENREEQRKFSVGEPNI